ncbi:MAG: hypothetical protein EA370_10270 [Wenzhouxiangella sp.]|nr:MAG: hypothetical protein EA370_10270 [Wenzhouxiangella sp.]
MIAPPQAPGDRTLFRGNPEETIDKDFYGAFDGVKRARHARFQRFQHRAPVSNRKVRFVREDQVALQSGPQGTTTDDARLRRTRELKSF